MKVLICSQAWSDLAQRLQNALPECEVVTCAPEAVAESLAGVDVIIPTMTKLGSEVIAASSAKLIQQYGVGLEGVDIGTASQHGIYVANVPSLGCGNAESVAELAILHMLMLARRFAEAQSCLAEGRWGAPMGTALWRKTVGIVGVGNVGSALAQRLRGFEVTLLGLKRSSSEETRLRFGLDWLGDMAKMGHLLSHSDFVIVCAALNNETRGLIGRAQFAQMKPTAFLLNLARGGVVDRDALEEALKEKRISGAGMDVFWEEPVNPRDPVFAYNVTATPHIGAVTDTSFAGMAEKVAENIRRFARGEQPLSCVNLNCRQREYT